MAFSKVLVANRGEIAVRVMRSAKMLGYRTVAVYSEADADALHVSAADEAVCIGPAKVSESYLRIEAIIDACKKTGADAVHPGYGFLSENEAFAQACADHHITFIGPTPSAIELMGSKRLAKIAMIKAGVPCVPGYEGDDQRPEKFMAEASRIGFPVMVKASAGGGGRGMRLVHKAEDLAAALATARSEAENAFGSGELILERAVIAPRHVEIQIFGDTHGNHVYLFERDCSIQRRHQKVVEEAPCPVMTPELRRQMGEAAVAAARSVDYVGAGTVEFLLDSQGRFYFLEMNTRLQVEHPVTELITGQDLVEWQLRVANGEKLPLQQHELQINGHAIEVRLYAEDPGNKFLPQTGRILRWQPATQPGLRIDHGMRSGSVISPHYDPMVAKVIAWGRTREDAARLLASGVQDTVLLGVNNNKQFLCNLLRHPVFVAGDTSTAFIDTHFSDDPSMMPAAPPPAMLAVSAAIILHSESGNGGWQTGAPSSSPLKLQVGEQVHLLSTQVIDGELHVACKDQHARIRVLALDAQTLAYEMAGVRQLVHYALDDETLFLGCAGGNLTITNVTHAPPAIADVADDGSVRAPTDGAVVAILVEQGDSVVKGQTLVIMEAMKIEYQLTANRDGRIGSLSTSLKQQVKKRQLLLSIAD
ncbi:acetyl/propionyl/methylcrotonyl-CoA carboxylase subunit alpha [Solimonas sp. K1W22B-7]|uniref:acetyl/propionyl/methylcrotonyl-CoA carboxylase subunit alpha n=1 Tax=Solimonas sp. K1W22B-7 TaxID=2303331 RepID=UPI000E336C1D|nr:acetyl/propionyl/methylcrotonyl-CoA carboxylase subunit alpha [Solimonas sp. K1W22B-7]AXQ31098.1 acetyl/propionyl/methylcrotonyl-CoA carboxylase subunit alpha [Solimonas sp. K1W22B-7]